MRIFNFNKQFNIDENIKIKKSRNKYEQTKAKANRLIKLFILPK